MNRKYNNSEKIVLAYAALVAAMPSVGLLLVLASEILKRM
jgi:hypothetical protein